MDTSKTVGQQRLPNTMQSFCFLFVWCWWVFNRRHWMRIYVFISEDKIGSFERQPELFQKDFQRRSFLSPPSEGEVKNANTAASTPLSWETPFPEMVITLPAYGPRHPQTFRCNPHSSADPRPTTTLTSKSERNPFSVYFAWWLFYCVFHLSLYCHGTSFLLCVRKWFLQLPYTPAPLSMTELFKKWKRYMFYTHCNVQKPPVGHRTRTGSWKCIQYLSHKQNKSRAAEQIL